MKLPCPDYAAKLPDVDDGIVCRPTPNRPPSPHAGRSVGCGKPAPLQGIHTIEVCARHHRHYTVQLPTGYDPNRAYPVYFTFHVAYGTAASALKLGHVGTDWADRAIIVAPQAMGQQKNVCYTTWWRNFADDLAFFDAMFAEVADTACVDLGRVYAGGQSSGAYFSASLACHRGDVLRGVLSCGGGKRDWENCTGGGVAAVIYTTDSRMKDAFTELNGCDAASGVPGPPEPSRCTTYRCPAATPLTICFAGDEFRPSAAPFAWDLWSTVPPKP